MAIYCGVVKLHRADAALARKAVDEFHNTRVEFQAMFANVFGRKIPKGLQELLAQAQGVRDRVLHGKTVTDSDYRMAIVSLIEYASEFNEVCHDRVDSSRSATCVDTRGQLPLWTHRLAGGYSKASGYL